MRTQVVGWWERRSWETSVSVRGENEGRRGEDREGGTERGHREGGRWGVEVKELRMSAIFSLKNTAKSSAVMED